MPHATARRSLVSALLLSLGIVASTPAGAITTVIYDFITTRNGSPHFLDSFNDGLPPPSAPNFANGTGASYLVGGTFAAGSETGGHLTLNSADGAVGSNALGQPSRTLRATLLSNADASNTTAGLKPNMTFAVSSLVDIALSSGSGSFGVRLSDRTDAGSVSHFAAVEYIPTTNSVRLREQDFVAHTVTDIATIAAPAGADQVRLSLVRPVLNVNAVFATAEFFHQSESMGVYNVPGPAGIFNNNNLFVRAEFTAGETLPVPEPESYAMMLVGIGLVGWQLRRRASAGKSRLLM